MSADCAVGLDVGSATTKGVFMHGGDCVCKHMISTGHDPLAAARRVLDELEAPSGAPCAVSGYGRHLVAEELGFKVLTEIRAHALGARHVCPGARLVADVGGQDTKVISIDEDGKVLDFLLNDRCAAGTGRFIEMLKDALEMSFDEFDEAALSDGRDAALTSTCAVFAQTEVVGLLAKGVDRKAVARGVIRSIARRLSSDIKRLSGEGADEVLFCGGGAELASFAAALKSETGFSVTVPEDARFIGAIGAALVAGET